MRSLLKRWWVWAGMLFVVIAILGGYLLIPIEQPRISQKNCDKIQLGWTLDQVKELLGHTCSGNASSLPLGPSSMTMVWDDEEGNRISVDFRGPGLDLDNLEVTQTIYTPTDLSLSERLKRRIERRINAVWP